MAMRIVVLGAGLQSRAICKALLKQDDVDSILLADVSLPFAAEQAITLEDPRVKADYCDASDYWSIRGALTDADAAISAVPYQYNATIARAAIESGCSFCDLGGNNDIVEAELAMHDVAQSAGVSVVPDCGLAPGLVSILAAHAVKHMDDIESISIRCGGIPQRRDGALDYALYFNVKGLINEYYEDALILSDGEVMTVPSLEDFEDISFGDRWGKLEAFNTSGGASTLPYSYQDKLKYLDYKTIRYSGHGRIFRALRRIGFMSTVPRSMRTGHGSPREMLETCLTDNLRENVPDVVLLRLIAQGVTETRTYQAVELPADNLTAMARMTGYPAAVTLLMLARGQVTPGAMTQENCVDPDVFLAELEKLGVTIGTAKSLPD